MKDTNKKLIIQDIVGYTLGIILSILIGIYFLVIILRSHAYVNPFFYFYAGIDIIWLVIVCIFAFGLKKGSKFLNILWILGTFGIIFGSFALKPLVGEISSISILIFVLIGCMFYIGIVTFRLIKIINNNTKPVIK
jgi:hypothetical protein